MTTAMQQQPQAPAGKLWEQLEGAYNWKHPSDRVSLFVDTAIDRLVRNPRPRRALDIGCGGGIALDVNAPARIREQADELWGLEPDEKMPKPAHVTHYQHALMETAQVPENYFDLAYSCLVMEHVADPMGFMKAVYRALKPGGEYFFMTMNARHYFVKIAGTLKTLKLDEVMLRVARGKQLVEEYHYPVQYKFNDERSINDVCRACGFEQPRYAYIEFHGPGAYFPGPSKVLLHALNKKRDVMKNPKSLLELYCIVRKPM